MIEEKYASTFKGYRQDEHCRIPLLKQHVSQRY